MTTISPLPTPVPSRDDPTNFATRADSFLSALPNFATQTNTVAGEVNASATSAANSATAATTAATNANNSATSASTSASAAATSATNVSNYATNAASSATSASTSASAAATSATNAASSASAAATSAASAQAIVLNTSTGLTAVRPTLLLDFANSKVLDSRVSFSRNTTAVYYDGKTFAKAEENLLARSQELGSSAWGATNVVVTQDTTIAPDGYLTADTVTLSAGNTQHYLYKNFVSNLSQHTFSIFAKAGTLNYLQLSISGNSGYANFDLSTGVVGTSSGVDSTSIVSYGNGWYRCIVTLTITTAGSCNVFPVTSSSATKAPSFSAAGTETVYLWGAQLEQRGAATAYTPTTSVAITKYQPVLLTASADVPRFSHDPVTGESLGLLVEEPRTNLLTYSEQFDNAAWIKGDCVVVQNSIIAPDGTLSVDKLTETATSSVQHYCQQTYSGFVSGTTYSFSCYAKAAERSSFILQFNTNAFGTFVQYRFTLSGNGSVTSVVIGTNSYATITHVGNGWYRCSVTSSATATIASQVVFMMVDNLNNTTYTGVVGNGLYIWGVQLEAASFTTSYIPTTTAATSRSLDLVTITGTNYTSLFRQDEGTMFAQFKTGIDTASSVVLSTEGSTIGTDTIRMQINSGGVLSALSYVGNNSQFVSTGTSISSNSTYKAAFGYKSGSFSFSVNGGAVSTSSSGTVPTITTTTYIGSSSPTEAINGYINKIAFYPSKLIDSEIINLTAN